MLSALQKLMPKCAKSRQTAVRALYASSADVFEVLPAEYVRFACNQSQTACTCAQPPWT